MLLYYCTQVNLRRRSVLVKDTVFRWMKLYLSLASIHEKPLLEISILVIILIDVILLIDVTFFSFLVHKSLNNNFIGK